MASDIRELSEKRSNWVKASRENSFEDGIKRLLTNLYPDNAHFIYELLQNAEDAQATVVRFILENDRVEFEHNGTRLFDINDIYSITSIGESTKRDDPTNIGKFGVGFKAVFAYTSTPKIISGEYCFEIHDLVVPTAIESPDNSLGNKITRFIFPFDSPTKSSEKAYVEIEKNLRQLDESTLLFLSNIEKVEYLLPDTSLGVLERKKAENNRVEISAQHPGDESPLPVYFLKFEKDVMVNDDEGKPKSCRVAMAFNLEAHQEQEIRITDKQKFDTLNDKKAIIPLKIVPLAPGRVSIFFPADKETSSLKFHLHAPFATTVSRDSVRDCLPNNELRDQIAELVSDSMLAIRNMKLLTVDFLRILPNDKDELSEFYLPIQKALVKTFQNNDLVPMKSGGHAAASSIYRGSAHLSNLINDDDLAMILGEDYPHPMWIANPPQLSQREDNFLSMLGICEWNIKDLVDALGDPEVLDNLLRAKPDQWHQHLYALLGEYLSKSNGWAETHRLKQFPLVLLDNGSYSVGNKCYFPSDDNDVLLPCIAKGIYSSGNSEKQQESSRKFLENVGVREIDETERVKSILKQRYSSEYEGPDDKKYAKDLNRFIRFVAQKRTSVFADYYIFKQADDRWGKPKNIYLDTPFLDTGLKAYYAALGESSEKFALSESYYEKSGVKLENIGGFAKDVGAITELEVIETEMPRDHFLVPSSEGGFSNIYGINEDFTVKEFAYLLKNSSIDKSMLVWRTMNAIKATFLYATYRTNSRYCEHRASSRLMCELVSAEWVPQEDGGSLSFVRPCEAFIDKLPKGFSYDSGMEWLKVIGFGEDDRERKQNEQIEIISETREHQDKKQAAKKLGFDSAEEVEEMAALKEKDPEGYRKWRESNRPKPAFPQRASSNPGRRREKIEEQMGDAPKKEYEQRDRRVRTTRGKINPRLLLKNQYKNEDGQMVCQVCKDEMPFRRRDGEYYFETVEALSRDHFAKEYESQFLALCPLCAAMYNEFIKQDEEAMENMKNALINSEGLEVPLRLGKLDTSVRFVEIHLQDIKTILENQE